MAVSLPVHSATTPLFLLMAEARAILAKDTPSELTKAQQKAVARKALEAKGEPIHHRCESPGCTTVITDIDLTTGDVRTLCWDHSGPHKRPKGTGQQMHCPCGSKLHSWCSTVSKRFAPNKPGPLKPEWADLVLA